MRKTYKLLNEHGEAMKAVLNKDEDAAFTAHTMGEARAAFKKYFGEKPNRPGHRRGGRKTGGTRRRLPVGWRVREVKPQSL